MHGTNVKIVEAQQARFCDSCKNNKLKLLKTNTAIWINKMCKIKHLTPNYINVKIKGNKSKNKKESTAEQCNIHTPTRTLLIYVAT